MSKHVQRVDTMAKFAEGMRAVAAPARPAKRRRRTRSHTVVDADSFSALGIEV
jgi:hypothetical protein